MGLDIKTDLSNIKIINPQELKSSYEIPSMPVSTRPEPESIPTENRLLNMPPEGVNGIATNSFEDALKESIKRINDSQLSADNSVRRLAAGEEKNIHHTMLELEQADISLRLALQVRGKVLEAYHELMRTQI